MKLSYFLVFYISLIGCGKKDLVQTKSWGSEAPIYTTYAAALNIFRPGSPEWVEEDYRFFGRTLRVLRENHNNFISFDFTPLYPTLEDGWYAQGGPRETTHYRQMLLRVTPGFERNETVGFRCVVDW